MDTPELPIELPLTEAQQAMIHQLTGEHATVLELEPEPGQPDAGTGRALRFRWRLSVTSGIPRQAWGTGHTTETPIPRRGSSA